MSIPVRGFVGAEPRFWRIMTLGGSRGHRELVAHKSVSSLKRDDDVGEGYRSLAGRKVRSSAPDCARARKPALQFTERVHRQALS